MTVVYMTKDRWNKTHRDYKRFNGGEHTTVTERGIAHVEIVQEGDSRVDPRTGYGRS